MRNFLFLKVIAPWLGLGVVARALGWGRMPGFVFAHLRQSVGGNPLKGITRDSPATRFTAAQLAPVVQLEDTLLALGLTEQRTRTILRDVVATTGARFIETALSIPSASDWRRRSKQRRESFVETMLTRFGNAEGQVLSTDESTVHFEITTCHFVRMTQQLNRPHLAPLFCEADRAFYDRRDAPLTLERPTTLANGDTCCSFRLRFREP